MKKYLAIATIASTLAFSSIPFNTNTTFAANNENTISQTAEDALLNGKKISTTESATNRVSALIEGNQKYEATYDKLTGILTITVSNLSTGEVVSTDVIDTNEVLNQDGLSLPISEGSPIISTPTKPGQISTLAATLIQSEKTFSNYEYFQYSDKTWEIRRPKEKTLNGYHSKNVKESTGSNSTLLPKYKSHVESINSLETAVLLEVGAGAIGIAITAFVPGGAIATGLALAALGYSATSYPTLHKLVNKMEDAYGVYVQVK